MLNATTPYTTNEPAFTVIANGTRTPFGIDDDAFARWVSAEGNELGRNLPAPDTACPGSILSDLVYQALSAHVIVGDSGIELNVHGDTDEVGYLLRLNNIAGPQQLVGLTQGRHELPWPPNKLSPSQDARRYLQEICCIANRLLGDLLQTT